jgi:hypothetical protein
VHVYTLGSWQGTFESTEEMHDPTWFEYDAVPLDDMMPADRVWFPAMLAGRKFIGEVSYGPFQQTLVDDMKIQDVTDF